MRLLARTLKRSMPTSLFGRALLILVLPILLLQVVVATLFIQRHYDGVTEQMAGSVAREINFAIARVEAASDLAAARREIDGMAVPFDFEIALDEGGVVPRAALRQVYDVTGGILAETMKDRVNRPMVLDLISYEKFVDARVETSKGVLRVLVSRRRFNATNPHLLLVWMVVTAGALTTVAVVFLRNQIRPIRELAKAATAFGRGRSVAFRPSGAEEVRRAGAAFLDMRARIERQIDQRTGMLSGVSHDLRTPLTRIKLALAMSDETPETQEIARDVSEMEQMLGGFLAFARGESGELAALVDPAELAAEVVADARRKGAVIQLYAQIDTPERPMVELRRQAIKRCLTNLIDNAATYAAEAMLTLRLTPRTLELVVEDDGPGIPPAMRETVLRPFTRLDPARNQNLASGVGLGLTIALDVVRSHGGALNLDDSPRLGGLRATVLLPR